MGSENEAESVGPARLLASRTQQQAPAVAVAAARVGVDMAREAAQSAWSTAATASRRLLSSAQTPNGALPWSKPVSPAVAASSRGSPKGGSIISAQDGPSGLDGAGSGPMSGAGGVGIAELQARQKVPTAAVGVAVGRSRPPQAFLQLAYGYLPLVWAGTLTHYLPAFLLQAGRILPVRCDLVTMRNESIAQVPAKGMLKYYRIS